MLLRFWGEIGVLFVRLPTGLTLHVIRHKRGATAERIFDVRLMRHVLVLRARSDAVAYKLICGVPRGSLYLYGVFRDKRNKDADILQRKC